MSDVILYRGTMTLSNHMTLFIHIKKSANIYYLLVRFNSCVRGRRGKVACIIRIHHMIIIAVVAASSPAAGSRASHSPFEWVVIDVEMAIFCRIRLKFRPKYTQFQLEHTTRLRPYSNNAATALGQQHRSSSTVYVVVVDRRSNTLYCVGFVVE